MSKPPSPAVSVFDAFMLATEHRQWVFNIPKRLRPYFMYDRKLLFKLSMCAWKVLSEYLKQSVNVIDPAPKIVAGKACCSPIIQKIYNVDPLLCSKCSGTMRIISFIEDAKISENPQ